jgi:hypothetical protein
MKRRMLVGSAKASLSSISNTTHSAGTPIDPSSCAKKSGNFGSAMVCPDTFTVKRGISGPVESRRSASRTTQRSSSGIMP